MNPFITVLKEVCGLAVMLMLNSCAVVDGICKSGAAVAIIAAIVIVLIIIWIISRFGGEISQVVIMVCERLL